MARAGMDYLRGLPALHPFLQGADHLDAKSAPTQLELEPLLRRLLAWRPAWLSLLFALRGLLAGLLGLKHPGKGQRQPPPDLMRPAGEPGLWEIALVQPPGLWLATLQDKHLKAHIIVALEPLAPGGVPAGSLAHLGTVVHYRHWTGPLYFNLIRPFHHLVVWAALRQAVGQG